MAVIELREGLTLDSLPESKCIVLLRRSVLIERLASLRRDWEQAADGEELADIRASVGLMLEDFARMIGIESEENGRR